MKLVKKFDPKDDVKFMVMGSPRDLELQKQLRETTSTAPILKNGRDILGYYCPGCNCFCTTKHYSVTMVGYFYLEGHDHDDNCRKFYFECTSCNMKFRVRVQNSCPTEGCDWLGKDICNVCGDNLKMIDNPQN